MADFSNSSLISTETEKLIREDICVGCEVLVRCDISNDWYEGKVVNVYSTAIGEELEIEYNDNKGIQHTTILDKYNTDKLIMFGEKLDDTKTIKNPTLSDIKLDFKKTKIDVCDKCNGNHVSNQCPYFKKERQQQLPAQTKKDNSDQIRTYLKWFQFFLCIFIYAMYDTFIYYGSQGIGNARDMISNSEYMQCIENTNTDSLTFSEPTDEYMKSIIIVMLIAFTAEIVGILAFCGYWLTTEGINAKCYFILVLSVISILGYVAFGMILKVYLYFMNKIERIEHDFLEISDLNMNLKGIKTL